MSIYTRNINVEVELLESKLLKAIGIMDNRANSPTDGETFQVEVLVSINDFRIVDVQNIQMDVINLGCREVVAKVQSIRGIIIGAGYRKKILELVGGKYGCTHLVELLVEIGRCITAGYHHGYVMKNLGVQATKKEYKERGNIECLGTTLFDEEVAQSK